MGGGREGSGRERRKVKNDHKKWAGRRRDGMQEKVRTEASRKSEATSSRAIRNCGQTC